MKKFYEWFGIKESLDKLISRPPLVSERDIWWVGFGENVGSEIGGKSRLFTRPGIVIKKLSRGFYMMAPTTTQKREGTWYTPISHKDKDMYVCLHQSRAIDYRRLFSKMGQIDTADFARIKSAFLELYK